MSELYHNLKQIEKIYKSNNRKPVIFDFKKASKHLLNIGSVKSNDYIHYIHYYPGRIFRYIPLYILSLKELADLDGYLLDTFAGSGTILLESNINPIRKRNSLGVEINPLARLISKVKTTPVDSNKILELQKEIKSIYMQKSDVNDYTYEFKNNNLWFSRKAIERLSKLKYSIENLKTSIDNKDFFWLCFSNIIRKCSKADPYIPPPVVLKSEKYKNSPKKYRKLKQFLEHSEDPQVWNLFENSVKDNVTKLNDIRNLLESGNNTVKTEIIWDDARSIKRGQLSERGNINKLNVVKLPSNSIDIIFTSPPYLTAQKYIRTNKLELYWLGYNEETVNNLNKSSIGTERISLKSDIKGLGNKSIDKLIDYTFSKNKRRGLIVYNYFKNMQKALKEMYRILKKNGYTILVVGNNKVLDKKVDTYKLLTEMALKEGFIEIAILKDKIRKRSMMTKRNSTGGIIINEYIIILKKED